MVAQIDAFDREAGQDDGGLEHLLRVSYDRQNAPVMYGVAAPIEQLRAASFDRGARSRYRGCIAAL